MSFMTDLKNLVKEANSNLEDLKVLLHETQPWGQADSDVGSVCEEGAQENLPDSADGKGKRLPPQLQMEQAWQRVSQTLQQIEAAYNRNQLKLTQLEGEVVVHL